MHIYPSERIVTHPHERGNPWNRIMTSTRKTNIQARAFLSILCAVLLCRSLPAHPGHGQTPSIPLPAWRLASDGRFFSAFFLKAEDDRVWLVDDENRTRIVSLADLDKAGQKSVQDSLARLRNINVEPTELRWPAEGVLAMALTAIMAEPPAAAPPAAPAPQTAKAFMPFERVKTHWDEVYLYVESNGLPDHPMMTGIKSWQQQVPLAQAYTGDNAWRIPLKPVPAKEPAMINRAGGQWHPHLQPAEQSRRNLPGNRRAGSMGRALRTCGRLSLPRRAAAFAESCREGNARGLCARWLSDLRADRAGRLSRGKAR